MLYSNAMSTSDKHHASYADLEALPDHVTGEIVDGGLYASPRPAFGHTVTQHELSIELGGPFDRGRGGPGGSISPSNRSCTSGEDVLSPQSGRLASCAFPTPLDPCPPLS